MAMKNTSKMGNPGAQGYCGFGNSFREENSNKSPVKINLPQTIANPKPAPVAKNTKNGSPKKLTFGHGKLPK